MSAIPPNNLDQLIAWVRVFTEEVSNRFDSIEQGVKSLSRKLRRLENEQPK